MKSGTIKTVKRYLFNVVAGLSLLLCVAIAGLWVRSYCVLDGLQWNSQHRAYVLNSSRGLLLLVVDVNQSSIPGGFRNWFAPGMTYGTGSPYDLPAYLADTMANAEPMPLYCYYWHGFGFYRFDRLLGVPETDIVLPLWVLLGLLLVLPVFRLIAHAGKSKRSGFNQGLCEKCGYDVRATPGKCPECGHDRSSPWEDKRGR